jgi:hypothetical protein
MRPALAGLLALCACGDQRAGSEGSLLETTPGWQAEAHQAGQPLDLRSVAPTGLPPDTLSVTLMAQSETGAGGELTLGVRDGSGRWLVDPEDPEQSPNRVLRGRGRVVAMLPSSSAALPLAADYLVAPALLSGPARTVSLSAWIKRGVGGRQELPLALVVVGSVVDDRSIDVALGEVGRIWRAAGIEVREPVRFSVQGQQAQDLARVEVDPALAGESPMVARALALTALAPTGTLTLIVVADLAVVGPGYPIWALSAGIPVPPASGAGVVVSAVLLAHDPVWAGQVMAHEMGHALGLYHTTEAALDGAAPLTDQIDDTGDHDSGNLMFWSAVRGATALTEGQGSIARRSALAR